MTQNILSLSYGKDSMACLGAIEKLGLPLDRIIHAEIWATDTIQADLPPMVEFKKKADKIIKERYGIDFEHISCGKTYEHYFYKKCESGKNKGFIHGFPCVKGPWCVSTLKTGALDKVAGKGDVKYIGIAVDEPKRIERNIKKNNRLPLVEAGWDESYCMKWCEENDLLSPIYTTAARGGVGSATIKV